MITKISWIICSLGVRKKNSLKILSRSKNLFSLSWKRWGVISLLRDLYKSYNVTLNFSKELSWFEMRPWGRTRMKRVAETIIISWEVRSDVRWGSGSKTGSVLFRSQQFGTDQICYPRHILTRTVTQETSSQPTQISWALIKIYFKTSNIPGHYSCCLLAVIDIWDIWLI